MRKRRYAIPLTVALLPTFVAGCGPTDQAAENRARETGYRGIALPEPLPVPEFTLADTEGRPFHFLEETKGKVGLLFFGYTHCPDICPVHMANLAAVLDELPGEVRRRVRVVFVTTDPARDSLSRLRSWLDRWDPSFVGLRGDVDEVNRIQRALNLPPAVTQARPGAAAPADSGYVVGHASQVLAIGPGGRVRVVYPFGTRQADWVHDLPKLVRELAPSGRGGFPPGRGGSPPGRGGSPPGG